MFRLRHIATLALLCGTLTGAARAEPMSLRVAVFDDAPPLGYRDAFGKLTGFSLAITEAICNEIKARCEFDAWPLEDIVDGLANDKFDIAAVGLLDTPSRRKRVLFTTPVYRSSTLWIARPGIKPGAPGIRIATFKGSAQEAYAHSQGWQTVGARTDGDIVEQLVAGVAQAAVVPLMSSFNLRNNSRFIKLELSTSPLQVAELNTNASFGINPRRAELKAKIDKAIETIKRNGVYDRVNSEYLSFRVN